ncbi:MAG: hypothetical protein KKB12_02220, partial [Candidatus Omnitrophica bacterium]|nr:hypothetical protein [Candidatus Omnitrophota bacterium]
VKKGYVNKEDMKLFYIAGDVNEAVSYIEEFYKIYHSVRYLGDLTIIRLKEMIPTRDIELLNREFKDILSSGKIEVSQPAKVERERGEYLDLPRLSMKFNRRDYGRLCEMIRVINKANNRGQASSDIKIT